MKATVSGVVSFVLLLTISLETTQVTCEDIGIMSIVFAAALLPGGRLLEELVAWVSKPGRRSLRALAVNSAQAVVEAGCSYALLIIFARWALEMLKHAAPGVPDNHASELVSRGFDDDV